VNNRALHRFALFTAVATFVLLGAGGLVTSHGVGMAVPDWPNTYGYNMFFFPFSNWVGGVFYEHTHRLLASGVGLCTSILAVWLYGRNARGFLRGMGVVLLLLGVITLLVAYHRWEDAVVLGCSGFAALTASLAWPCCEPAKPWLRKLGLAAFFAVVLQGILGGLRVVLFKDQIGIFHATLAQLFFVLVCALALFTSTWWQEKFGPLLSRSPNPKDSDHTGPLRGPSRGASKLVCLCAGATVLILAQLILGATMRHQHAGLAIPDFPLAYGKLWPAMDPQSVAHYNQQRIEVIDVNPITAPQIILQMVHRFIALCIFGGIACCAWLGRRVLGQGHLVARLALGWFGLILAQVLLGAATIWSNKAADIATAHVLVGALSLALGTMLSLILLHETAEVRSPRVAVRPRTEPSAALGSRPSPASGN
jgi:cytochrome c oxidase assembly protein subunit 15